MRSRLLRALMMGACAALVAYAAYRLYLIAAESRAGAITVGLLLLAWVVVVLVMRGRFLGRR